MILLNDICKYYGKDNTLTALSHIHVHIKEGEYVSIMGPSGSGKSTLMNILGCLDRPSSGTYFLCGEDVSRFTSARMARLRSTFIGFVFQSFFLLDRLTVFENIELPMLYTKSSKAERKERVENFADRVGLTERLRHYPGELSGGQRQRVAIARALVNHPKLILADEPTGNLDPVTGKEIMRLFGELHTEGVTIVLITHDVKVADEAERVFWMKDGKLQGGKAI